jgi:hypothetical protein
MKDNWLTVNNKTDSEDTSEIDELFNSTSEEKMNELVIKHREMMKAMYSSVEPIELPEEFATVDWDDIETVIFDK